MMALRSVVCLLALLGVSAASQLRVVGPDGRPAAGADVRVVVPPQGKLAAFLPFKADGTSDEEGGVDLRVPLVSGALIVVDHPGFAPASVAVGVKTSVTEIRLAAGPHWAGQVQVAGDAKVPSGGRACISGTLGRGDPAGERRWRRCAAVGAKGEFAIAGLGPPPWKLSVTVPGFLAESAVVSAGRSHPQRLRPGVTLQGSVSDEQGSPLAGVVVRAGPEETASGEDGTFDLAVSRLPATLTFTKESFLDGQAEVADTQRPLTVRLASAPTVTATLLTPEGPYSGKLAVWYRSETGPGEPDALASRDATVTKGALAVPLPGPGAYSFVLRPEGYQEVRTGTVPVGPDQRLSLGTLVLAQGCGVTGEVTDEATGAAVSNVLIDAIPVGSTVFFLALARGMPAAVSDRKGRFAVGGLRPGRYLLRLQRADLAPAYRVVSVASLMDLGRLTVGAGIVLGGRVTGVGGAPQDGVEVRVFDPAREAIEPLAGARTDADGQYRLPALGPGRYRIELWRGRLLNAQELVLSRADRAPTADFEVGGVVLHGLLLSGGLAVPGGKVYLASTLDRGRSQPSLTVNYGKEKIVLGVPPSQVRGEVATDGSFTVEDAPTGNVWLTYDSGRCSSTIRLQIQNEPEVSLPVALSVSILTGRVSEGSGRGLVATVSLVDRNLEREVAFAVTEVDGSFTLDHVQAGSYRLMITRDGYLPVDVDGVTIPREEPLRPIVLTRGEGGRIRVELRRPDQSPAAFVPVSLFGVDGRFVLGGFTTDGGAIDLPPLPAGEYRAAWADPLAGAGAEGPVQLERGNLMVMRPALADAGSSLTVSCPVINCAGKPVESLTLKGARELDLTPLLSGVTPELRFGEDGIVSLGRIAPARYTITLGVDGKRYTKELNATSDSVEATF